LFKEIVGLTLTPITIIKFGVGGFYPGYSVVIEFVKRNPPTG
jgi:hypothetical protein